MDVILHYFFVQVKLPSVCAIWHFSKNVVFLMSPAYYKLPLNSTKRVRTFANTVTKLVSWKSVARHNKNVGCLGISKNKYFLSTTNFAATNVVSVKQTFIHPTVHTLLFWRARVTFVSSNYPDCQTTLWNSLGYYQSKELFVRNFQHQITNVSDYI